MGSCFSSSKTFRGQGRTLNEASSPAAPAAPAAPVDGDNGGRRLGGAATAGPAHSSAQPGDRIASGASQAEREARAKAAEQRMSKQAAKGTPAHGKLSKQLEQQRNTNALLEQHDNSEPQRVVVSCTTPNPPPFSPKAQTNRRVALTRQTETLTTSRALHIDWCNQWD